MRTMVVSMVVAVACVSTALAEGIEVVPMAGSEDTGSLHGTQQDPQSGVGWGSATRSGIIYK